MSATLIGTPAASITIGTGGAATVLPWTAAANGLQVTMTGRAPTERRAGTGAVESIYLPGYGLRTILVEATTAWGVAPPSLSALSLPATHQVAITWCDGTTTTLTAHVQPLQRGAADLITGTVAWSIRAHERAS